MKYQLSIISALATIAALALPAAAQHWQFTGVTTQVGESIDIDADSVRRSIKKYELISYKIKVGGISAASEARISGNCHTGSWRISSSGKQQTAIVLPKATGDRLHQFACTLPAVPTIPRR